MNKNKIPNLIFPEEQTKPVYMIIIQTNNIFVIPKKAKFKL